MLLSLSGFLFQVKHPAEQLDFVTFCSLASSIGYSGVELRTTQVNPKTSKNERKEMLEQELIRQPYLLVDLHLEIQLIQRLGTVVLGLR